MLSNRHNLRALIVLFPLIILIIFCGCKSGLESSIDTTNLTFTKASSKAATTKATSLATPHATSDNNFTEISLFNVDMTNDGTEELLLLQQTGNGGYLLKVCDTSGIIIWSEEANITHAGWNSLYFCTIEGKNYILRYMPEMSTGSANYHYELLSLDLNGKMQNIASSRVNFDFRFENKDTHSFDIEKIVAFVDEVNNYLDKSYILLSTESGSVVYSTKSEKVTRKENLSWLEHFNSSKYQYDEKVTLFENLNKFEEYMESVS